MDLGSIIAHLKLDMTNFSNSLNEAQRQIEETSQDFSGMESAGKALQAVGAGLTAGLTVPVMAFGKSAVEATTQFNASLSKTGALMGATTEDMNKLRDAAKEYGATTQFSASECSDALGYMALAGWDATQSVDALPGVLNLAASSGMELAAASDLVTDYLSAFGMEAGQAGEMSDVLAYAQAKSNTTTEALGQAFKNCAANCHAAGMDVQTTTALLGQLANQGLKGSEAGTALTAVMRDMTAKMKDGEIQIGKTKVKVQDANGNYRDMIDILSDVEKATAGMGDAERASALASTFTADSIKGLNLILNAGTDTADKFRDSLYKCDGTAQDMADKMNDNLAGDIKSMQSAFESMQIAVGEKLDPILRAFVQTLTKIFSAIGKLPAPVLQVIMVIAGLLAVIGPVILLLGTFMAKLKAIKEGIEILKAFKDASGFMRIFSSILSPLKALLGSLSSVITGTVIPALQSLWAFMLANPIVLVIAAIAALVAAFIYCWNNVEGFAEFWKGLGKIILDSLSQISGGVQPFIQSFKTLIAGVKKLIGDFIEDIKNVFKAISDGDMEGIKEALGKLGEDLKNNLKNILAVLPDVVKSALGILRDVIMAGIGHLFDPFINWGYSVNTYIGDAFTDMFGIVKDILSTITDLVGDWIVVLIKLFSGDFKGAFDGMNKMLEHLKDNIGNILKGILNVFIDITKAIIDAVKNWVQSLKNRIIQGLSDLFNNIIAFISELPGKIAYGLGYILGTVIRWGIELTQTLIDTAKSAVDGFIQWWTTLPSRLSNWLQTAKSNIQNWVENIKLEAINGGKEFVNNVINYIKNLPSRLYEWLQRTIDNINTWVSDMKSKASSAGQNFVTNTINHIKNLPSRLWTILMQTINKVISFATNLRNKGLKAGRDFLNSVINGIKSLPGKLYSIGANAVQGLINGLKSGAGSLWNAATGLAKQAFQGMKDALQIKSPSHVFRDKIGKMIPEGVVVGIKLKAKDVYRTLSIFSDNLVKYIKVPDIATNMDINSGGIVSNSYLQNNDMVQMLREVKEAILSKKSIDYDKMADAFSTGASKVDNTIYMDKDVVGRKVAHPVKTINDTVKKRLDKLEGVDTDD